MIKVLIPTDFTAQADFAYMLIENLTKKSPMEIHFLHVMNFPETVSLSEGGEISTCGEIDVTYVQTQLDMAKQKMETLKNTHPAIKEVHIQFGKTKEVITEFAKEGGFDMIAMGSKGASGIRERLSGTETQHVARTSTVPVLSLMCDRSTLRLNHILFVHDFKDESKQELALMKKMVQAHGAQLHFLQVIKNENERAALEQKMLAYAALHELANVSHHFVKDQDVESGVVHFNQMHDMDMICIGTHGKGGFFHTSATEKLIKHLHKPIISFQLK